MINFKYFLLGLVWMAMSLILDLPFFMAGPMKMELAAYIADIGLTYLIFPLITFSFAYIINKKVG